MRQRIARLIDSRALDLPPLPGVAAEVIVGSLDDQADVTRLAQTDPNRSGSCESCVARRQFAGASCGDGDRGVTPSHRTPRHDQNSRNRDRCVAIEFVARTPLSSRIRTRLEDGVVYWLWAKEVARACRKNTEMAYLCGLLHNIGTPVLLRALASVATRTFTAARRDDLLAEFGGAGGECSRVTGVCLNRSSRRLRGSTTFSEPGIHVDAVAVASCAARFAQLMLVNELSPECVGGSGFHWPSESVSGRRRGVTRTGRANS